jgi:hypothetical protein
VYESVTQSDVAEALPVLRDIIGQTLPADQWSEVDRVVTTLTEAFVSGNGDALRQQTTRLELLGPERDATGLIGGRTASVPAPNGVRSRALAAVRALETAIPVTIYLSDGRDHELTQSAVERVLGSLGFHIVGREDPVAGSWFRRMLAAARSPVTDDPLVATALVELEARYLQPHSAQNTALLLANLGPLLASLQSTKDAVVRVGAFLVVKVDWTVVVTQLTPQQQLMLNHSPQLATAPQKILYLLGLPAAESAQEFLADNIGD